MVNKGEEWERVGVRARSRGRRLRSSWMLLTLALACAPSRRAPNTEDTEEDEDAEATEAPASSSEWIPLFNGRDLTGWDIKITGSELNENYKNTFRVEDGVLKVSYDEYQTFHGEFGHLFYQEPFSHYILRVEYRFVGEQVPDGPDWAFRNSGAMLHSQSAASMGLDQEFPVSIEAQFLGGRGSGTGERTTGNLCTPGTNVVMDGELITEHCVSSTSKTYHGDSWVTLEMEVRGDGRIRHSIDGETIIEYTTPQIGGDYLPENYPIPDGTRLTEGYIALQAESHPVEFRRVELKRLTPD